MLYTEFKIEKAEKIWKEEAFQDGIERGKELGREEGIEIEKNKRLKQQIEVLKELNISNNIIIEKICRDYEIEEEEVKKYL